MPTDQRASRRTMRDSKARYEFRWKDQFDLSLTRERVQLFSCREA